MADHTGWRNFWWFNVALFGLVFLACLFGFPETRWHRVHPGEMRASGVVAAQTSSPVNRATLDSKVEKGGTLAHSDTPSQTVAEVHDPYLGKGAPSKQQWRFYQPNAHPFRIMAMDLWVPWKLFTFLIVEFASFVVSWSASALLTINLTQSEVFAAPPYDFSSESIGFMNFAPLVGALIGLFTAGPLSDWTSMQATRRNKGIREPEMRLPTMIPYVLIMLLGNFITAFGYQYSWDWRVNSQFSPLWPLITTSIESAIAMHEHG